MCGIAGIFHIDGQRSVDSSVLRRMADTIVHRGPDDEGYFLDGPVGFGVRRLSIVDVKLGHQPLCGEDGTVWIAFNGEIYNHPELRDELLARGHRYLTNCDTETVVHAYEEYGERMVDRLCGMFAFALWDKKKRKLLLYRDRIGIKPLYYTLFDGTLLFASEIKALLEYGVPFAPDETVLECYLRLGYVPGTRTMFHGITKLLPGHYLSVGVEDNAPAVRQYWEIHYASHEEISDAGYEKEFEELLGKVMSQHRLGEVPQGVFLSGGVDSSALVAISAGQVEEPLLTFSVGYADSPEVSEFPYARKVAAQYGTKHREFELSMKGFAEALPRLIWHMDEPVADDAAIPLFFISRLARDQITVVHSGEGADEVLAGYMIYKKMQLMGRIQRALGPLARPLATLLPSQILPYRMRGYANAIGKPLEERYHGVRRLLPEHLLSRLGRNGFPSDADRGYRNELFGRLYQNSLHEVELNRMLHIDLKTWLPDDLLVKADKMTMAASLELRVPFLDHRVVEFAASLPCDWKIRNGESKYLLKQIMRKRLPSEILTAPKRGFPVPVSSWLRGGLFGWAKERLLDSPFLSEFIDRAQLERLLSTQQAGTLDLSDELYGLLCLSIWHEVFSQGKAFRQSDVELESQRRGAERSGQTQATDPTLSVESRQGSSAGMATPRRAWFTSTPPEGWDAAVCYPVQSVRMAEAMRTLGRVPFYVQDGARAALVQIRDPLGRGGSPLARAYVYASNETPDFLTRVLDELRARGIPFVRIGDTMWGLAERPGLALDNMQIAPRMTFRIDLTLTNEQLMQKIRSAERKSIRKAERSGVEIAAARSCVDLEAFVALCRETNRRIRERGGSIADYPRAFYEALFRPREEDTSGEPLLILAQHNGRVIAGNVFLSHGDTMIYFIGASSRDREITPLQAPVASMWKAICTAKARGLRCFDLGGCTPDLAPTDPRHGVHEFKKRWGGAPAHFYNVDLVFSPFSYRLQETFGRAVWKVLHPLYFRLGSEARR